MMGGEMTRFSWVVVSGVLVVGVALAASTGGATPAEFIAEADALYDRWQGEFEFASYEARLRGAIAKWEAALAALPGDEVEMRAQALVSLARAYFELADAYLGGSDRKLAYAKGEAAALGALRLEPEFVRAEGAQGFRAALGVASDVGAIFWYGNNLGRLLNYDYGRAIFGGTRDVSAAFARAVELDEAYWGGGPHRALANFLAQTPGFLGGNEVQAGVHFARAIELDPSFVQNYVDQAEFYAKPRKEWDALCRLLRTALGQGADPAVATRWPLYNHLAVARAQALLAEAPGRCP